MERATFLEREYVSLREEIKETKARIFKLAGFGLVGMPTAYYIAQGGHIIVLSLSLPLLICTLVLLFIAESRALMRAGRYIKDCIEPAIAKSGEDNSSYAGWENWLEGKSKGEPSRRVVDQFVTIFFYLLFSFYYVFSVSLAVTTAKAEFGVTGFAITIAVYIFLGLFFVFFLWRCFGYSTKTSD